MTGTKFLDNVSDKDIEIEPEPEPRAKSRCPDGGWGWVIVLGAFVCNVIVDGICFTFGIYVQDIIDFYGADESKSVLVGSLLVGCYLMAGPVVSALANKFGCRKVTIFGSLLTCLALLVSTCAPSIEVLMFLYGVVGGIGMGLIYLPSIVIIGYWFERKRAFATGIAVCGSGIGALIFAPINRQLLEEYDWKQSLVIVAGIVLNCAVCGALFRPIASVSKKRMKRGIVTRGSIMKALIAEKERQRTISNGSLDNCIITKDNRLIKIDKIDLRNKSVSYINKLKKELGFSSGSLNRSKNSLIITPVGYNNNMIINIVESVPSTPVQEKRDLTSTPIRSSRRKRDYERRRDSGNGSSLGVQDNPSPENLMEMLEKDEAGLSRQSSVVSRVNEESSNLLDPSSIKQTQYLGRSSGSVRSSANTHLSPESLMTSLNSSVRFAGEVTIDEIEEYSSQRELPGWCLYISNLFDLSLLKNKAFVLYAFTSFLSMLGFFIPYFFIPMKMKDTSKGQENSSISDDGTMFVLSILGIATTIGRVLIGWVADRPWANTYLINNGSLVIAGIVTVVCPFLEGSAQMTIFAVGFGFFTAGFLSLRSIVLVDLIGLDRLTSSFGLLLMFQGIASIAGPPLAGRMMDSTSSIDSVFYLSGSLLTMAGIFGCFMPMLKSGDNHIQYEEEEMVGYPMNSELEMIEQVKLPDTRM
ncbi:monocarboxylate transporter 9-like [Ostrea edulis]|uniref:monocarboxylate transporter 9-like n=1 Tax=Ostrea edulis TaxID=37623 RepID=UPI002095CDA4|nr:monocarboxylate transporter 9-like [Ostrea edulis]XP_048772238.1 monocarboxylate transporter 9-like [Ostrea edulis]XP_048772239.1 monocarboxylate transporter 9-like [Ostrea edulis]XP_048772240.1 monocarboxylate transporter 9-like [Ostrea edulis]XP_056011640.1 monocarboxylate transporter 9-like [Ostrea edulis]XP_056011641.1 monocarboxylate transporter 9-like [Ostrea edulis]XP_056011642.1 monocarboxylate transporter 9-like [Ostrea edulis]XP_056011643.1 monocarboxylate transporter 9-like [Os